MTELVFAYKSFCFTGKLADLKRTAAEREVRARGGLTTDRVNERLDYLVIGDEPSPAWKYGRYGRKIEQARTLAQSVRTLRIVSEATFMDALALVPSTNSGAIDGKVVVCNYSFMLSDGGPVVDTASLESLLGELETDFGCHVTVRSQWASARADLFGSNEYESTSRSGVVVACRLIRHQSLDQPVSDFISAVEQGFERVAGVDGRLRWFERSEGSADYIRLFAELPSNRRVPGL